MFRTALDFAKSRVGNAVVLYLMLWLAILWIGGIGEVAALITLLLADFVEVPIEELFTFSQMLVWIAVVFGGIYAAIQLVVGKENLDYG